MGLSVKRCPIRFAGKRPGGRYNTQLTFDLSRFPHDWHLAYAQAAGGAAGNEFLSLLPMIGIFVVFLLPAHPSAAEARQEQRR